MRLARRSLVLLGALAPLCDADGERLGKKVLAGPTECDDSSQIKHGDKLSVTYTGWVDDASFKGPRGEIFDSSLKNMGASFDYTVGSGEVIYAWDKGFIGMCPGARVELIVPPVMGYNDGIQRRFEVDLIGTNRPPNSPPNLFRALDRDASSFLEVDEIVFFFSAQGREMPETMMEHNDKDGDGRISCTEFEGPKVCEGANPVPAVHGADGTTSTAAPQAQAAAPPDEAAAAALTVDPDSTKDTEQKEEL